MPRVSVIIPTYNCDRFLPEAIDSVLMQTYQDYEIIIIDDGSTDQTCQVLESYSKKIRYFYQQNQGVAVARNLGLEMATGELIAFLDHDDFWLPQKLELQVTCFQENPQIGIVHSGWRRVNAQGEKIVDIEPWHYAPKLDLETWLQWKPILPSAMIFARHWLTQVGGFDYRFSQTSDVDMVFRLSLLGCHAEWVKYINVCYRQHQNNTIHNGLEQAENMVAVMNTFFSKPNIPDQIIAKERKIRYHTLVWISWYLYYTGNLQEMNFYLRESLNYTYFSYSKSLSNWIQSFSELSKQNGSLLDTYLLTQWLVGIND